MRLTLSNAGKNIALGLLRFYKLAISPWLGPACRFHPSCSDYMRESVEKHGAWRGIWMGVRRLGKCHPFHEGGFDPVP
jgi:putative membrane protein insertion efficiency factor